MEHKIIASIMVQISQNIVWPVIHEICKEEKVKVKYPFQAKVGSGSRTYHILKKDKHVLKHTVTYGQKMVLDKFDYERARKWLTGREISEKGFLNSELSFKNLMAHTILHEMAHALQTIMGDRLHKSVHNPAFYRWLKRLHKCCGEEVVSTLELMSIKKKVNLEFKEIDKNYVKDEFLPNIVEQKNLKENKFYSVVIKDTLTLVKLLKINPKNSVVVIVDKNSENIGFSYNVPISLVREAHEDLIAENLSNLETEKIKYIDVSKIKIFKKYNMKFRNEILKVQIHKKNISTVIVEIIDG